MACWQAVHAHLQGVEGLLQRGCRLLALSLRHECVPGNVHCIQVQISCIELSSDQFSKKLLYFVDRRLWLSSSRSQCRGRGVALTMTANKRVIV